MQHGEKNAAASEELPTSFGFPETRWSLVVAAREGTNHEAAKRAMAEICQLYWYPLYTYARRCGLQPSDAEDRTQDFFQSMIQREMLELASEEKGKLRAYFLTAMKRFIVGNYRRDHALKRGGGMVVVPIDQHKAESRLAGEPGVDSSPDALFDQSWAYALLDAALDRLRTWYIAVKREALFEAIKGFLGGMDATQPYVRVAASLKVSETALRSAIFQMRRRYRALVEEEIAHTVSSPEECVRELIHLKQILSGAHTFRG